MEDTYVHQIESVFYLKENQDLSQEQINKKLKDIVIDIMNESHKIGFNRCKKSVLDNVNNL